MALVIAGTSRAAIARHNAKPAPTVRDIIGSRVEAQREIDRTWMRHDYHGVVKSHAWAQRAFAPTAQVNLWPGKSHGRARGFLTARVS